MAQVVGVVVLCLGLAAVADAQAPRNQPTAAASSFVHPNTNPAARRAFDHFYNTEYDKAIQLFEGLAKQHPNDPFANNYLLCAVLFRELYRVGALDAETYADDDFLDRKAKRPLDPATQQRIKDLIARTEALTGERLKVNDRDVEALYARGVARAMRSTFMGMGEKAWLAAVRSAMAARRDHERVLELNPNYVDAKMSVGVHNYIIGSLNWAARTMVALVGVRGNRKKGLDYLREVARANSLASMDAKIALALFLRREEKYEEALELVRNMTREYPRSFLTALEYANLLNAAGHGREAIKQYEHILANYKARKYPVAEPEVAAWGLGVSLRGQREFLLAAQAFDSVSSFPNADADLVRRATLAAGEMYDTLKRRDAAVKRYEQVIAQNSGDGNAELARRHMRQPYQYR